MAVQEGTPLASDDLDRMRKVSKIAHHQTCRSFLDRAAQAPKEELLL
jgi:hypothetical protein